MHYIYFFNKQPIYKQLSIGWLSAKQLSGLNVFSLSDSKNYRLTETGVFLCSERKIAVKPTIYQNSTFSKALLEKILNHWS